MEEDRVEVRKKNGWAGRFFTIWTGQAFSIFGSQLVNFALIWWLTMTTGSATVLATASIVGILPQIILGPLAGVIIDRGNRRIIMMLADGAVALATAALAASFILGWEQTWQVYLVLFLRAVAGSFHWPAMAASTSLMVPKEHLARVQGANQTLNGGLNIIAAPLAALLLESFSVQVVLGIDIATALLAILPLFFIPIPQPPASPRARTEGGPARPSMWEDLRAGLGYVGKWPGLLLILMMATLINLVLTPAFSLLPLLVKNDFAGGAMQLAWVEAAAGIGTIAGGLALGIWGGFKRRILTTLLGLIGIATGSFLIGFTPSGFFLVVVGAMLWMGIMMPMVNGPLLAVIQAIVAPEMQGRVFTLISSLAAAMSPLGLAIAGPLADIAGVRTWFILGGIVTACTALMGFLVPAVFDIESRAAGPAAVAGQVSLPAPTVTEIDVT